MNVHIAICELVRTFEGGQGKVDGIRSYALRGVARLEANSGWDGPSFDDASGPSYSEKRHASDARIWTSVVFVTESSWENMARRLGRLLSPEAPSHEVADDRERVLKSTAFAWYLPVDRDAVRGYGAADHDVLECFLRVENERWPKLRAWLNRCAMVRHLIPALSLTGLYFQGDEGSSTSARPKWSDFLAARRPGTFDDYWISFKARRRVSEGGAKQAW